jgi:hypothetical protein
MQYAPDGSETVERFVSLTMTVAPAIAPPPASLTVPHTLKLGSGGAGFVTMMCAEPVTF